MNVKVRHVMSHTVVAVAPDASVKHAAQLLDEHHISALPVIDAAGALVGIVSEADLLPVEARPDPRSQATPLPRSAGTTARRVAEVMSSPVITVSPDDEVSTAARRMIDSDVKRLPVLDGASLVGIVSRRDLVKVIAREDAEVRVQLYRRLLEAGIEVAIDDVSVEDGIARLRLDDRGADRRLADSIGMTVPGLLEVRFEG